jgi:hypothetical protein
MSTCRETQRSTSVLRSQKHRADAVVHSIDLTLIKLVRTTAADFGEGFGEVVGWGFGGGHLTTPREFRPGRARHLGRPGSRRRGSSSVSAPRPPAAAVISIQIAGRAVRGAVSWVCRATLARMGRRP